MLDKICARIRKAWKAAIRNETYLLLAKIEKLFEISGVFIEKIDRQVAERKSLEKSACAFFTFGDDGVDGRWNKIKFRLLMEGIRQKIKCFHGVLKANKKRSRRSCGSSAELFAAHSRS